MRVQRLKALQESRVFLAQRYDKLRKTRIHIEKMACDIIIFDMNLFL